MIGRVLVRHGRTGLNVAGRLLGRLSPLLDMVGTQEVQALAVELAARQVVKILSHPLIRAVQTTGTETWLPATMLSDLIDRDYGPWGGQTRSRRDPPLGRPGRSSGGRTVGCGHRLRPRGAKPRFGDPSPLL